jgi:hypothetical protein
MKEHELKRSKKTDKTRRRKELHGYPANDRPTLPNHQKRVNVSGEKPRHQSASGASSVERCAGSIERGTLSVSVSVSVEH